MATNVYSPNPALVDNDDDIVPEPVYFSLMDPIFRREEREEDSHMLGVGEEEEDELSDSEMEIMDLTAPPPQAWFHGCITRQETVSRLKGANISHCYLVRESQTKLGTYVLSYMAQNNYVHHFRIHTICGDYYIGNRQFLSLQDLIGYYSRNYVVEDGFLQYPVPPPQSVNVYMMLRALSSYTKKQPEEIDVHDGEVFLLKNRMDDNWAWGTSQLTGQSGMIPLIIMEEVVGENPWYYGKSWFRPDVSRDEAIELLKARGEVGSFIVRPSMNGGYSMAVRTNTGVQRFFIEEMKEYDYYLSLGGRQYSSIDDIIERYKKEDISADVCLTEPVEVGPLPPPACKTPTTQPASVHVPVPNGQRSRNGDKDKSDVLLKSHFLTKKGKKLIGRWKPMFLVLDPHDGQLQFYEKESNHRAKGLLDLVNCQVFPVHRSLTGMADSFSILSRYGREEQMYYLSCENAETSREWFETLAESTQKISERHGLGSQVPHNQIHSLTLSVREIRMAKPPTHSYFFFIYIDDVKVGRSVLVDKTESVFEDVYKLDHLPGTAKTVTIEVLYKQVLVSTSIGSAVLKVGQLPNGQQDDQWHPLMISSSKVPKGSARITVTYEREPILELDAYRELGRILIEDNNALKCLEIMANVFRHHHAELACTLVHLLGAYGKLIPIVLEATEQVIKKEESVATLFRSSSLATMLMDQYMKQTADTYLRIVLEDTIKQILESQDACEIDPNQTTSAEANLDRLKAHFSQIVDSIFQSADSCPRPLRHVFYNLQQYVSHKWPNNPTVRITVVSGFLFLRLFTPALMKPQLFNMADKRPSPRAERTLNLLSRVLQKLGNMTVFKARDTYMLKLNDILESKQQHMGQFIENISNEPTLRCESMDRDPTRNFAHVCLLCRIYRKDLEKYSQTEPGLELLLTALDGIDRMAQHS